jgi:predicted metal-binding membrane protein
MSAAPANSPHAAASVESFFVPERTVYLSALIVFAVAAGAILCLTQTMSGGMPMPGNWTMSMMWMGMPSQTWIGAALSFVGMWLAMMIAMMLPSSLPMLLLYRRAAAFRGETHLGWRTFVVGAGYFFVWAQFGVIAYLLGKSVAHAAMASVALCRVVPFAASAALVLAGIFQISPWKSACLRHCRDPLSVVAHHLHGGWRGALGLGIHHGAFCAACCWALMLIQLVLGVMNVAVMVTVGVVIALEKLISRGELVARISGAVSILGGVTLAASSAMGWQLRL